MSRRLKVQNEPSAVVKALLMKDLADLVCERDAIHCERDALLKQRSRSNGFLHGCAFLNEAFAREQSKQIITNNNVDSVRNNATQTGVTDEVPEQTPARVCPNMD